MPVSVQKLTKSYGTQLAVNGVSFEVKKGEILGFLGPNGAGKSTTMKILAGYIPPTSGTASICGQDILQHSIDVRKKTGYLPENNPLYHEMYVKEFLEFSAQINKLGNIKKRTAEIIGLVGLDAEQSKKIGQLSKGYKQRVGLAQALLHDPQVLILDEPTSGLDPNQLSDIRSLIKELGKEKTIIFSTHIMQEVESVCGRVIIIDKGNIAADDTTENLQRRLKGASLVTVEFEHAISKEELENLDTNISVESSSSTLYKIQCPDSSLLKKKIFELAAAKNNPLLTIKEESQSLETIFQQLTQKNG